MSNIIVAVASVLVFIVGGVVVNIEAHRDEAKKAEMATKEAH